MSYNREWDRGKDSWTEENSWNSGSDSRGTVHPREEDYYGEGKRRKFNNGGFQGYDASQAYDESNYDTNYAQSRQTDYSQDYTTEERPQQRGFVKKRLLPSEPSPHVIFLGLDPDFTEADLQAYLTANGCSIETVTIIRERSSGTSKGFGFAQFASTEHARAFVDPLFPFIQVPPPASHGASAAATFYKALETGVPHNGRRVKIDYSQSATPHEKGRMIRQSLNDGTRDIGNTQAPVLLFRGLDPLSGPQAILQAMKSSSGLGKEGAKGMRRIILIKDKVTMASYGFAFVEFVDVQSASAVLAATMSSQIHPSGFRISDRPVAASFAHPYSFQPADTMLRDDACIPSSSSLGGAEGSWVRYWDETSTIAMLEFEVEEPVQPTVPVKDKKEKRKPKGDSESQAAARAIPTASILPVSDKPVTLNFSKGAVKINATGPVKPLVLGFSMDDSSNPADDPGGEASSTGVSKFTAKKVAPLIASKKTVNNINKWNQVQEELTNDTGISSTVAPPALAAPSNPVGQSSAPNPPVKLPVASTLTPKSGSPVPMDSEFEFADVGALSCLLCARQFKSIDQLKRHNKESDLHKKNFKDANLRDIARQKAIERKAQAGGAKPTDQPKYRDRASERRILFNQPDAPVPEKDGKPGGKKKHAEGPPPPPPPPPPPVNPGQDESNVGNKLLKMMGWKEGTGLGTSGEGRVEPIQTAIYAQGAGLGASKGKEIGKSHSGGYVEMAKDTARERYGS